MRAEFEELRRADLWCRCCSLVDLSSVMFSFTNCEAPTRTSVSVHFIKDSSDIKLKFIDLLFKVSFWGLV